MMQNVNPETNIRYGVISGNQAPEILEQILEFGIDISSEEDETHMIYESNDSKFELVSLGGSLTIYVKESPHIVECRLCSPCCPNAGDLTTIGQGSYKTYSVDPASIEI